MVLRAIRGMRYRRDYSHEGTPVGALGWCSGSRIHKVTGSGDVFGGVNEGANEMKTGMGTRVE
jgi:hypothetical protein